MLITPPITSIHSAQFACCAFLTRSDHIPAFSSTTAPSSIILTASNPSADIDFTNPGKDLLLAYVVFSFCAGAKAIVDDWRTTFIKKKK